MTIGVVLALSVLLASCNVKGTVSVVESGDSTVTIKVSHPDNYLLIPIENAAAPRQLYIVADGRRVLMGNIRVAVNKTDNMAPVRMPEGMDEVKFEVVGVAKGAVFVKGLKLTDDYRSDGNEDDRPLYHYTSAFGWMGPPAGAAKLGDTYHLFYECNPYGVFPENYHWGHARSKDLFEWEEQDLAFGGDSIGEALGGTCIVDKFNTFGAGTNALIAVYTATRGTASQRRQEQCIAYAGPQTEHFVKFVTNPVLRTYDDIPDFRHPGIFRYRRGNLWEMVIACGDRLRIYSAEDLGNWNLESYLGKDWGAPTRIYEGAQMVEMPSPDGNRWVLLCNVREEGRNKVEYHVGNFDGKTFTPLDGVSGLLDSGNSFFCAMPVDNVEGKTIVVGWLTDEEDAARLTAKGYHAQMSMPRELELQKTEGRFRLIAKPVREAESLRKEEVDYDPFEVTGTKNLSKIFETNEGAFEVDVTLSGDFRHSSLQLFSEKGDVVTLTFPAPSTLSVDRSRSMAAFGGARMQSEARLQPSASHRLHLFVDRNSVEVFADNGSSVISEMVLPEAPLTGLRFSAKGAPLKVRNMSVWRLAASDLMLPGESK